MLCIMAATFTAKESPYFIHTLLVKCAKCDGYMTYVTMDICDYYDIFVTSLWTIGCIVYFSLHYVTSSLVPVVLQWPSFLGNRIAY